MGMVLAILVACALIASALAVTGWWRPAFAVFTIRPAKMTVEQLGLSITDKADAGRVDRILRSFITAFNRAVASPRPTAWVDYSNSLPALFQPFAHEGGAMGYTLRRLFRYNAAHFEATIVRPRPEFRYLYYVGLGFWSGIRKHRPHRLARITRGLDPLHGHLVYDGYGFARTFFEVRSNPSVYRAFDRLEGYARNAAYQGVGRALFFLHMGDVDRMIEEIRGLGSFAPDAAAGVGLALVFVNPDRLDRAARLAEAMPAEWRPDIHLGMCFGLKARSINNLDAFEKYVGQCPKAVENAIRVSIRECDRVELLVRAEARIDGYQVWRERVTKWMSQNIEFPIAGVRIAKPEVVLERR